jgi:uncharacterized delta-60 repeat protein
VIESRRRNSVTATGHGKGLRKVKQWLLFFRFWGIMCENPPPLMRNRYFLAFMSFSIVVTTCVRAQVLDPDYKVKVVGSAFHRLKVDADGNTFVYGTFDELNGENFGRLLKLDPSGNQISTFANLYADGSISDLLILPDNKILICGTFTKINGVNVKPLLRLNADGSIDNTFLCNLTAPVKIKLQSTGKIIVLEEGVFQRVNTDGSLDATFTFSNFVSSLAPFAIAPDNSIYFTNFNIVFKLTADGADDGTFQIGVGSDVSQVHSIAVQADGKVLVGGNFKKYNNVSSRSLVRLHPNGIVDLSFVIGTGASGAVYQIVERPSSHIIIGGQFSTYNGQIGSLVELNTDGSLFKNIAYVHINDITSVSDGPDGKITVGGLFQHLNSVRVFGIGRFKDDYTRDESFLPKVTLNNSNGLRVSVREDLSAVISGDYEMRGIYDQSEVVEGKLFGVDETGAHQSTFHPDFLQSSIYSNVRQPDGKVLMSGWINTSSLEFLRIGLDGKKDISFKIGTGPMLDGFPTPVYCIKNIDGMVLLGGRFTSFNGVECTGFVEINDNGSVHRAFTSLPFGSSVWRVERQSDGKLIVIGHFPFPAKTKSVLRLNVDGTLDPGFHQIDLYNPADLAIDSEDNIYIVGDGLYPDGVLLKSLIKLKPDGFLDATFDIGAGFGPDIYVVSIIMLPGDKIAVGGYFDYVQGVEQPGFAMLDTQGNLIPLPTPMFGKSSVVVGMDYEQGQLFLAGRFRSMDYTESFGVARVSIVPLTLPAAPQDLNVVLGSPGKFSVTWEDQADNESMFMLERSVDELPFTPIDTLDANSIATTDAVVTDKIYRYRVRAKNLAGYSAYSNTGTLTWAPLPEGVLALTIPDPTTSWALLTWTSTARYHSGYIVERAEGDDGQFIARDTIASHATGYIDPIELNHTYRYRVKAFNKNGHIESDVIEIFWYPQPEGTLSLTIPDPTSTTASLQIGGTVAYHDGYIVDRMIGLQDDFIALDTIPTNATSFVDVIEPETEHRYRVRAYNRNGELNSDTIKVSWRPVPTGDLSLSIPDPASTTTTLTISANLVHHAGYIIERSSDSIFVVLDTIAINATTFLDEIERDKQYWYRVRAFNRNGFLFSNVVSVSWRPIPQGTLTLTVLPPNGNQASLSFNGALYQAGFIVERSVDSEINFVAIDTLAESVTTFHDAIAPHKQYRYRVKAFNKNGSISSGVVAAAWRPVPVGEIAATIFVSAPGEATLSWTHTLTHHLGFAIQRSVIIDDDYLSIDTVTATAATFSDVTDGNRQYHYRVIAFNPAGSVISNTISMLMTDVERSSVEELVLWPNPANSKIFVDVAGIIDPSGKWKLIRSNGMTQELSPIGSGMVIEFDLSHLPAGMFVLQYISVKGIRFKKIMKH